MKMDYAGRQVQVFSKVGESGFFVMARSSSKKCAFLGRCVGFFSLHFRTEARSQVGKCFSVGVLPQSITDS